MEWLVMFVAISLVAGVVVWLAGRARAGARDRPAAGEDEPVSDDPDRSAGPRHYDIAVGMGDDDPGDAGP